MIDTPSLAPEVLTRFTRFARERHIAPDTLLSDVIEDYLDREETLPSRAQIDAAYTDDPNDDAAAEEEASLARSRRHLRRSLLRTGE